MEQQVASVFRVVNYRTGKAEEVTVDRCGQEGIKFLRTKYPRHTKFVLEGFEIDGNFSPLYIKTRNYD